jgi:hypothetical protein
MKKIWHGRLFVELALVLALAAMALSGVRQTALGKAEDEAKSAGGAHYTVVETQGHNLLVTDNATNKLYFYTVDKDKPIGSPLKLRASLDLSKVGQPELRITDHRENKEEK